MEDRAARTRRIKRDIASVAALLPDDATLEVERLERDTWLVRATWCDGESVPRLLTRVVAAGEGRRSTGVSASWNDAGATVALWCERSLSPLLCAALLATEPLAGPLVEVTAKWREALAGHTDETDAPQLDQDPWRLLTAHLLLDRLGGFVVGEWLHDVDDPVAEIERCRAMARLALTRYDATFGA